MAQQNATEIRSIDALSEGDSVRVTGNGADVEHEIESVGYDSWKDRDVVSFVANGFTYTLYDNDAPLCSDGIRACGIGAVQVELVDA